MAAIESADRRRPQPEVSVILPGPMLRLFPTAPSAVRIRAGSVRELLDELDARWPGMRDRLSDTSPAVRRHLNVFVDGQRATLETELAEGSEVFVVTAMSGG